MTRSQLAAASAAAAVFLACAPAEAAAIVGLYDTGVDDKGAALVGGDGVVDPHYRVLEPHLPGTPFDQAVTAYEPGLPPDDGGSRWIATSARNVVEGSITTYRLSFDLGDLDPATAHISGLAGVDQFMDISLNTFEGDWIVFGHEPFTAFHFDEGFVPGLNTLTFRVSNTGALGAPSSFRIEDLAGTAAAGGAPEPATWALMLMGFLGLGAVLRRRPRLAPA